MDSLLDKLQTVKGRVVVERQQCDAKAQQRVLVSNTRHWIETHQALATLGDAS